MMRKHSGFYLASIDGATPDSVKEMMMSGAFCTDGIVVDEDEGTIKTWMRASKPGRYTITLNGQDLYTAEYTKTGEWELVTVKPVAE
jgi:hypothetical protein